MPQDNLTPELTPPRRGWLVYLGILVAFAIFFLFVSVLYWYWIKTPEPTSIIKIPTGNAALDGTRIHIEGGGLKRPVEVTLNESNKYGTRIYLVPGDYVMEVFDRNDRPLYRFPMAMAPLYERTLKLVGGDETPPPDSLKEPD